MRSRRPLCPARIMAGLGALAVHLAVLALLLIPQPPARRQLDGGTTIKLFVPAMPAAAEPEPPAQPEQAKLADTLSEPHPVTMAKMALGPVQPPAPVVMAVPTLPAVTAALVSSPTIAAPRPTDTPDAIRQAYARLLWRHIAQRRPAGINLSGVTMISFRLDAQGDLLSAHISRGSGILLLDKVAMRTLFQAAPYPPPPDELAGEALEFAIPFSFR